MPDKIEHLLQRRNDISPFLVHLTRDSLKESARTNLLSILTDQKLSAKTAFGMAKHVTRVERSQRVVCFTETPLEHIWMICRRIQGRKVDMSNYGIVFRRSWGRERGANPVWYLNMTGDQDSLTNSVDSLVSLAEADRKAPIFKLTPFLEQVGPTKTWRKDFSWEREWRIVGHVPFVPDDVVAVLAPEADHEEFSDECRAVCDSDALRLLDPNWGLERMISELAISF